MAAGRNLELLVRQIERFRPELVSVATAELASDLATGSARRAGRSFMAAKARSPLRLIRRPRSWLSALVGALGLGPTLAAIKAGKDIAFANKEVLVIAGEMVTRAVREYGVRLLPVDSEHNAIFQCLEGRGRASLKRIILTASGGPFLQLAGPIASRR